MAMILAAFDPPSFQQWMLIAALGLALVLIAVMSRRRGDGAVDREDVVRRERGVGRAIGRTKSARAAGADEQSQRIQGDFEQLLTELENLSGRITVQVEEEFGRLQGLMTEADRRISALRVLIEASRQLRESPRPGASTGERTDVVARDWNHTTPSPSVRPADRRLSESSAPPMTAAPSKSSAPIAIAPAPLDGGLESDPRFAQIYNLADAGFAPRDIAHKLGESIGTVELVLNLRSPNA